MYVILARGLPIRSKCRVRQTARHQSGITISPSCLQAQCSQSRTVPLSDSPASNHERLCLEPLNCLWQTTSRHATRQRHRPRPLHSFGAEPHPKRSGLRPRGQLPGAKHGRSGLQPRCFHVTSKLGGAKWRLAGYRVPLSCGNSAPLASVALVEAAISMLDTGIFRAGCPVKSQKV